MCYVGQPVAVLVARERYLALDALGLIEVDYEPLTPVLDPFEAMKDDATPIHQELATNVGMRLHYEGGDLLAAFSRADHVVRQRYEGQMHGGIAQGAGQALMEGISYTPDGQPLTGSLLDYALPTAEDLPDLVLDVMETPSPTNPLGVQGIGELPTVTAPVAMANAVMNALSDLGVRQVNTPLTPEKIWRPIHPNG